MRRILYPSVLAMCALALLLTACGSDNSTTAQSPCDDANTRCLTLYLKADQVEYQRFYDNIGDQTAYGLRWAFDSTVLKGYAPGRHIILTIAFVTPLAVRYDHDSQNCQLLVGASGSYNRWSIVNIPGDVTGNWPYTVNRVNFIGVGSSGESTLATYTAFQPLTTGETLRRVTWEFTVPDTYDSGGAAGSPVLPADITGLAVLISTSIPGDTGDNPPVWPGDYQP